MLWFPLILCLDSFFRFFSFSLVSCSVGNQTDRGEENRGLKRSRDSDSDMSLNSVETFTSSTHSKSPTPVHTLFDLFFRVLSESSDQRLDHILRLNCENYTKLFLEIIDFASGGNDETFGPSFQSDFAIDCVIVSFFAEAYVKRHQIRNVITLGLLKGLVKTLTKSEVQTEPTVLKHVEGLLIKLALTGDLPLYKDLLLKYLPHLTRSSQDRMILSHCLQYFSSCDPANEEEGSRFRTNLDLLLKLFPRANLPEIFEPPVEFEGFVPKSYYFVVLYPIRSILLQAEDDLTDQVKDTITQVCKRHLTTQSGKDALNEIYSQHQYEWDDITQVLRYCFISHFIKNCTD